jgi:hypothetical protein
MISGSEPGVTRVHAYALCLVAGWLSLSCLYDSAAPCGEKLEVYGNNDRCTCPKGSIWSATGCVQCGRNEVASATSCDCKSGYSRPAEGQACTKNPSGLGVACDKTAPCSGGPYDTCAHSASGAGYCTKSGCSATSPCDGAYACDLSTGICLRPPLGAGAACEEAADCKGTEATFCDMFVTHECLVQGCTLAPDNCFPGTECCEVQDFGISTLLCVAAGECRR